MYIRDLVFLVETSSKKKEFEDTINTLKVEIDTKLKNSEQEIVDELHLALEELYSLMEQAKIFGYSDNSEGYLRLAPEFLES